MSLTPKVERTNNFSRQYLSLPVSFRACICLRPRFPAVAAAGDLLDAEGEVGDDEGEHREVERDRVPRAAQPRLHPRKPSDWTGKK